MKLKNKIIIVIIIIAILISVAYILYKKYGDRTYIGRIESIYNNIVVADCYDGRNSKNIKKGKYRFSTESVLIVNKKGKKIDVSKLSVGDTVEIYLKHDTVIKATFPEAGIPKKYITKIKLLNEI